jgi:hypothetical protein
MVYTVRAISGRPGEGNFVADKPTRKAAVETALGLLGQGMTGVTIEGDGRFYQPSEFHEFFLEGES